MVSKRIVFMAVFLVMVFLIISSEVAADRELIEASNTAPSKETRKRSDGYFNVDRPYRCRYGCCNRKRYCRCCTYPGEQLHD